MNIDSGAHRHAEAARNFNARENRSDGLQVASSLVDGLNMLRDSFFTRVHADVQNTFGTDSMLMPVSAVKSEAKAGLEIDVYLIVESALHVREAQYVHSEGDWFEAWLAELRLGPIVRTEGVRQRLAHYGAKTSDQRRHAFAGLIERSVPEARQAPLVMYRLLPLAAVVATSIAFHDYDRAVEARKRQIAALPSIRDCPGCHGGVRENSEKCPVCGNPFWQYAWLTAG
jgi:hypothetical protein